MGKRLSLLRFATPALLLISSFCIASAQQPQGLTRPLEVEDWAVVKGAVRVPTRVKLRRPVRLAEILAVAGGVKGISKGDVLITHEDGTSATYRLKDIRRGNNKSNPRIQSGDIIRVAE